LQPQSGSDILRRAVAFSADNQIEESHDKHEWNAAPDTDQRLRDLHLVVEDGGDGIAADHADWVNAGFVVPQ
jgi:hypothetical protein